MNDQGSGFGEPKAEDEDPSHRIGTGEAGSVGVARILRMTALTFDVYTSSHGRVHLGTGSGNLDKQPIELSRDWLPKGWFGTIQGRKHAHARTHTEQRSELLQGSNGGNQELHCTALHGTATAPSCFVWVRVNYGGAQTLKLVSSCSAVEHT